jgi:hypothetical protein
VSSIDRMLLSSRLSVSVIDEALLAEYYFHDFVSSASSKKVGSGAEEFDLLDILRFSILPLGSSP